MPDSAWSSIAGVSVEVGERRGPNRRDVMIPAAIVCEDGDVFPCIIRDLSEAGAKVGINRRHTLPPQFKIAVDGQARSFPVKRIWRRGDLVGIRLDLAPA